MFFLALLVFVGVVVSPVCIYVIICNIRIYIYIYILLILDIW